MLAAILALAAVIYAPSLRNGWVWDDTAQIVTADGLHSWRGLAHSFVTDAWWFQDPAHQPKSAYYRPRRTPGSA